MIGRFEEITKEDIEDLLEEFSRSVIRPHQPGYTVDQAILLLILREICDFRREIQGISDARE